MLRSPDVRFAGVQWETWSGDGPFLLNFTEQNQAYFYFVKRGAAYIRIGKGWDECHYVPAGTTVAVEGRAHQWMDLSHVDRELASSIGKTAGADHGFPVEISMARVDIRTAVLQRLRRGILVIPSSAKPHSEIIRGCVDLVDRTQRRKFPDQGIVRRLAEVIMLELVAFARAQTIPENSKARNAKHDEYLLRALSAFFARPEANWTVADFAEVAGISRTALVERFRKAFQDSPMRVINRIRLELAAEMLLQTRSPLSEIAAAVGFGSSAAFLRAFRREYHVTPNAWRSKHAGQAMPPNY